MLERNPIKANLEDYLSSRGLDPRWIEALALDYVTPTSLRVMQDWLNDELPKIKQTPLSEDWLLEFKDKLALITYRQTQFIDQGTLLKKFAAYFRQLGSDDPVFLKSLEEGHCIGFTSLVTYSIWLNNQPKKDSPIARDDWEYIHSVFSLLARWDEKSISDFDINQQADIERILNLIKYFQFMQLYEPVGQGGLNAIHDTSFRKFYNLSQLGARLTEAEIQSWLDEIDTLEKNDTKPDLQLFFYGGAHNISFIRVNNQYYFYDPNNLTGFTLVEKKQLAMLITLALQLKPNLLSAIGCQLFSLDPNLSLPDIHNFLSRTEETLTKKWNDVGKNYNEGITSLQIAAWVGSKQSVNFFLNEGVDINAMDKEGRTALQFALHEHHAEIAEILLMHGAKLKNLNNTLKYLQKTGDNVLENILRKHFIIESIKNKRGDILIELIQPLSPKEISNFAYIALQLEHFPALHLFLRQDIDLFQVNNDRGENLIHYAVSHANDIAIQMLLKKFEEDKFPQPFIDTPRNDGLTALGIAAAMGNKNIVQQLLDAGADPRIKNSEGLTPIKLAQNAEIRQLLMEKAKQLSQPHTTDRLFQPPEQPENSSPPKPTHQRKKSR